MAAAPVPNTPAHYRRHIEAALVYAGGSHSYDDVAAEIEAGTLQMWGGEQCVIVTQILVFPRRKVIHFFLASGVGNLAEIEAMTPVILEWARTQGCTSAQFTGRRGWERTFLTRTGWEPKLMVFEKAL